MGNVEEATVRIDHARAVRSTDLDLSSLGLTIEDLKGLINYMDDLPITVLNVGNNELTGLPAEIQKLGSTLEEIFLEGNDLKELPPEIKHLTQLQRLLAHDTQLEKLPPEIGDLVNLKVLDVGDNFITELPPELGKLINLIELDASENEIRLIPQELANCHLLQTLNVSDNALEEETIEWLDNHFLNVAIYNMAYEESEDSAEEEEILQEKWENLYTNKEERAAVMAAVQASSNLGTVTIDYAGGHMRDRSAEEVINEFLKKTPLDSEYKLQVYGETAKQLIQEIIDPKKPIEERKDKLAVAGVSLGDCDTPVKAFLRNKYIENLLAEYTYEELSPRDQATLQREAVYDSVSNLTALHKNEKAEQVDALADTVFADNAINHPSNPRIQIVGNSGLLPPGTAHSTFAYGQVNANPELIEQFTRLICETDNQGNPVCTSKGEYTLDIGKIDAITTDYIIKHGFGSPEQQQENQQREKQINTYYSEMSTFLQQEENQDLYSKYDISNSSVQRMMDLTAQQNELRKLLEQPKMDIEKTYKEFVSERKSEITDFIKQNNNPQQSRLEQFTIPMNSRGSSQEGAAATAERTVIKPKPSVGETSLDETFSNKRFKK